MNVDDFRALVEIAESGSLSAAAVTLNASQPGLSRLVQRVESELGARVFERSSGGVRLTPAGELAVDVSRDILRTYDRLRAEIARLDNPDARVIRVVASSTPGEFIVPDLIAGFAEVLPGVVPRVTVSDSAVVFRELLSGTADLGFAGMKPDHSALASEQIASDEIVLAVPQAHSGADREISIEELDRERLIVREGGSATIKTVWDVLAANGITLPSRIPSLTLSSTQSILSAVASGLGVGFVTNRAFGPTSPRGVAAARIRGVRIVRELFVIYPKHVRMPAYARTFLDFVRSRSSAGNGL